MIGLSENMRSKNHLIFLVILLFLLSGCNRPKVTGVESDKIDTTQDPIQKSIPSADGMIIELKNIHFTLTPVAEYKLAGMVVGKKTYSDDWEGEVSPIDLAMVWGKLAEPEHDSHITYRQSNRWYFYQFKAGSPFNNSFVISRSANNHIIPANENIHKALKMIGEKDMVVLEGVLVNMKGTYKGQTVTWNTSLSRTDTGNGSCELFYVTKVRIETKVYE
jgi:hypothetical protein